ncbi:hypothetical protein [Thalassiella azotivora]
MTSWVLVAAGVTAVLAAVRGTWSPCGLSMVSAINPMSERSRGNRYGLTCAWFVLGAALGGLALGAAGSLAAWLVSLLATGDAWVLAVLGASAALVATAADTRFLDFRLPLHPRQVNEVWLDRYRRWVYAAGFGAQIGSGFATYVMTASTYLLVVLAALTASPAAALALGGLFGLVRGAAVLLTAGVRSPGALMTLHRRLERLEPWSLRLAVTGQLGAATLLGAVAAGPVGAVVASALGAVLLVVARPVLRSAPTPRAQRSAAAV